MCKVYSILDNKEISQMWKEQDQCKKIIENYSKASEEDVQKTIDKNGFFEISYTGSDNERVVKNYSTITEFMNDKNKLNQVYKILTDGINKQLALPENLEDRKKYIAYTDLKYDMLDNKELGSKWKLLDEANEQYTPYLRTFDIDVDEQIRNKGYFELDYKYPNGKVINKRYTTTTEFVMDKTKFKGSLNTLKQLFDGNLNDPSNLNDKKRYERINDLINTCDRKYGLGYFASIEYKNDNKKMI